MPDHTNESDHGPTTTAERVPDSGRTARAGSPLRSGAARRAAAVVGVALHGRPTASAPAVAMKLGVANTRALHLLRGEAPLYAGDLLLLAPGDALAALDAMRAEVLRNVAEMPVERRLARTTIRVGQLAAAHEEARADGVITADEREDINRHALAVAGEALAIVGGR